MRDTNRTCYALARPIEADEVKWLTRYVKHAASRFETTALGRRIEEVKRFCVMGVRMACNYKVNVDFEHRQDGSILITAYAYCDGKE